MRTLSFFLLVALSTGNLLAQQDCKLYFLDKPGSSAEYHHFDGKEKYTGKSVMTVKNKTSIPGGIQLTIESTSYDKDEEKTFTNNFEVKCINGVFTFQMDNYFTPQGETQTGTIEITGDELDIPANPVVGQMLKEGTVTISMTDNPVFRMSIKVTNRKIEAIEPVTTPAGTFECVKISFDVESKMVFTIKAKGIEWYAPNVGLIRSESYDTRGKLTGKEELVKLVR